MPDISIAKLKVVASSFALQARNLRKRSPRVAVRGRGPAVSLTSYGSRLKRVHLTIESIGAGDLPPARLLLWLTDADYQRRPGAIRRLERRGLEVRTCPDWGPHKKYYPYCAQFADDDRLLVTADDDVLYPKSWLQDLAVAAAAEPGVIWAHRVRRVASADSRLLPYEFWSPAEDVDPSIANCMTGVSGVAYPPRFQHVMRSAGERFTEGCLRTDDLWLHVHAVRSRTLIGQVGDRAVEFPQQLQSQRATLAVQNTLEGGNDAAIAATYSREDIAAIVAATRDELGVSS